MALYYSKMRLYQNPQDDRRDRFILSKGHANPPYYAILADKRYFPKSELKSLRRLHSILQGHPDANKCPGVDCSTGSLGQGYSIGVGIALGLKMQNKPNQVYVLVGDGELDEGITWEASMAAANYKLDNLTVIVDQNHFQLDGTTDKIMSQGDLSDKFRAFGFDVQTINGHDFNEILNALDKTTQKVPRCIICNTVKGKGVSFMEQNNDWHGKAPSGELLLQAERELGGKM